MSGIRVEDGMLKAFLGNVGVVQNTLKQLAYYWDPDMLSATTVSGGTVQGQNVNVNNFPATYACTESGTWNITNISGTVSLPTGAATAANQATGNTNLATLAGAVAGTEMQVDVLTMPSVSVTGTFWQATQPVSGPGALSYGSGQVNSLGNNTLITPAAGKKIRVYYFNYNPLLAVEAGFRFGAAGTLLLRANVTANSVIAKDYGDFRYVEGAVNEALILNLSLAVNVIWNAFYLEI